ncbi:signal peptidase I [Kitasatospora kazusensis]|uniref:signal peptidase I n=1 Tax=Kitasatospora kazusensis TaxID=407974 RepID=UPI0031DF42EB
MGPGGPEHRVAARGRADRRRTARRAQRRRRHSLLRDLPVIAVVALLVALVLKTFMVQVFVIPSGSMEQTIQIGDRVLVDKLTPWFGSEPVRGDVVVFKDPGGWLESDHGRSSDGPVLGALKTAFSSVGLLPSDDEQDLIKRVIGVPGDTVVCCDAQGRLTVNGTPLDESYLAAGNVPSRQPFKVTVPAGRLWVMGDHRDVSADSRYHMANPGEGTIPMGNVVGRAFVIAWPVQRIRQLGVPASLSSLPVRTVASAGGAPLIRTSGAGRFGAGSGSAAVSPDPAEPPLVMGVLGVIPFVVRPRPARARHGRSTGPPPAVPCGSRGGTAGSDREVLECSVYRPVASEGCAGVRCAHGGQS